MRFSVTYDHLLVAGVAFAALLLGLYWLRRWREDRRAKRKLAEAVRLELDVPASLHPVIDPDVCIGSGSCLQACPEGKILGMVDGVATLINASKCIGHGKCAAECPVSAIKLVFGTAERGVELPEVDAFFETSRPGIHIVGELAGMGLIKNALIQGLQVAARLRDTIDRGARPGGAVNGAVDVAIVGAGPAGIATAVGCRAAGLSYALIEQDTVGGTVAHYPRQKLVMTEAIDLPYYGKFGQSLIRKETLVSSFHEVITRAGLRVHERTKLTAIDGARDAFVVTTDRGMLSSRRVVLAIGRRGTPRRMGVPGEELDKVTYRLIDPRQYAGKRVLVVGGGDSALEAAIQLVEETDAQVAISYRRPEFARCRPLNKQKMDALLGARRVEPHMSTEVAAIEREAVVLKNGAANPRRIDNDFVIACLGGELPNEFLKSLGISIRKHHGDRAMANPTLAQGAPTVRGGRLAAAAFTIIGALVVAGLVAVGWKYYLLPRGLRYKAPGHAFLKPSGLWGHGVGILATLFMLLNFVYPMRKRLPPWKGRGSIVPWLRFHVFVGIMSPIVILFHTAFQWGNQLATSTYLSVVVVVTTGLVGRFIYGWVRIDPAETAEAKGLRDWLGEMAARVSDEWRQWAAARAPELLHVLGLVSGGAVGRRSLIELIARTPREALRVRRGLRQARPLFVDRRAHRGFCAAVHRFRQLETKMRFHRRLKRLMSVWRALHVVLAIVLLALIAMHVWVSLRVGFKWLWHS
jgi:thioredoxin reductase/NAD-dependent dihydropyrimidine dehydrogenase PreA subunit